MSIASILRGTPLADTLAGSDSGSTLEGLAGNDVLVGGAGDDYLDGGTGSDTMKGGAGRDAYVVDSRFDMVTEALGGEGDRILLDLTAAGTYHFCAGVEEVIVTASNPSSTLAIHVTMDDGALAYLSAVAMSGNAGANRLSAAKGDDTLDGGPGRDTLEGGDGDDTYRLRDRGDTIVELPYEGRDTVEVAYAGDYTLAAEVEVGILAVAGARNLTGNDLGNALHGTAGANVLSGGAGSDFIVSNGGNDTLDGGTGSDTARILGQWADFTAVRPDAKTIILTGNGQTLTLRSIELVTFDDEGGEVGWLRYAPSSYADHLVGGPGNDTIEALGGNDHVSGGAGDDSVDGGAGDDTLAGGSGNNTLAVGSGSDLYYGVTTDVVVEAARGGTDTIETGLHAYSLAALSHVENLSALGTEDFLGTGNAAANVIRGNNGHDTLDGGEGNDTLIGDDGNDMYVVDRPGDVVVEAWPGDGTDTVHVAFAAAGTYVLGANLEHAVGLGPARTEITGNGLANHLGGHAGSNVLKGEGGNDTLEGGGGKDTLHGGSGTDRVILKGELAEYTVHRPSAAVITLAHSDGSVVSLLAVEELLFLGPSREDASDDRLVSMGLLLDAYGSPGSDTLLGSPGNDTLRGGAGGDIYRFGAGGGHDLIQENDATARVVDTLVIEAGSGNVAGGEVRFTRSATDADDLVLAIFSGEDGNRVDTVTIDGFFAGDALNSRAAIEQFRFIDGNVTLTASQAVAEMLKGTAAADAIRGSSGNDNINGREGDDSIGGAAGNDTLIGNSGDDQLSGDAGADLLQGNLGSDALSGGDGNDILDGGAAADTLDGGSGNDVLLGGTGHDLLAGGSDMDTLAGGAGATSSPGASRPIASSSTA